MTQQEFQIIDNLCPAAGCPQEKSEGRLSVMHDI